MAVSFSLCSLRHWVKCSAVSCCSPTAEYRPLSLIHSVNKSRLVWSTCSTANQAAKTASQPPMAAGGARVGGAKREEKEGGGGPKREQRKQSPPLRTSSLLSPSFVPCCHDHDWIYCNALQSVWQQSTQGDWFKNWLWLEEEINKANMVWRNHAAGLLELVFCKTAKSRWKKACLVSV